MKDDVDMRIADILAADGRVSNREIARRIGLSEAAVRNRVNRMISDGVIRFTAQVNLEHLKENYLAVVALKLDNRHLERCAQQIEELPGVQNTMIVTGQYDLLITVLLGSRQGLVDFVTHQLSRVEGVRESETFVVLNTYRQWIPASSLLSATSE